ncbi:MAG: gliding motility-associated C-terminal domain-containing protein, partial [Saprospirales bacterium]
PVAICKNSLIEIRPSITDSIAIAPGIVDGGSFDNCSIADFSFFPEYISCTDAGIDKTVLMVVADHSGNKDSCTALLKVEMISFEPQFSLDLCNPDTLFLFADFPEEGSAFGYQWSGPANFSSTQANPIIAGAGPLNSGIYHVTVTGFGGCQAIGSVNVNISPIATPSIESAANVVCEGDEIVLSSSSFSGSISYNWYRGVPPSGVLLGTTSQPGFSINLPVGIHRFYVVAENPDCSSNPSASVTVEVVEEPVAVIDPSLIRVCENSSLSLSSPLGPSFTYQWTGPAGFVSDLANPIVTNSANISNSGNYFLVVRLGTCISDPVSAEVIVESTPAKPIINGDHLICVGDSLNLRVPNIPIATRYTWKLPDGSEIFTSINQLTISNANVNLSGEWQVTVAFGDCSSEVSDLFSVLVEEQPVPEIYTNSPVCHGDSVLLIGSGLVSGQYIWTGPGGFSFTGDSIFQPLPSGNYHLWLTSNAGCAATTSINVVNKIRPEVQAIVQQGFDCVDGSSDYCLQAVVLPSSEPGLQYNWSGPMNFSSGQAAACISNITEENNGIYRLIVSLDGCESDESEVEVEVTDIGFTPQIAANSLSLCTGDSLLLSSNIAPGANVRFNWITPLGPVLTTDPQLKLSNLTSAESGVYALFVSIESCSTGLSQELNVVVNPRPATPVVSGGGSYCAGDSIVLNADGPDGTLYFWMGPVDLQQGNATQVLWPANPSMNGQYSVTALKDGCTSLIPAKTTVVVNPLPNAPITELSPSRICLYGDRIPIEICVPGDSLVGGAGISYFLNNELEESILSTFSLCATWDDYDLLNEGSNSIRARIQVDGCWSDLGPPVDLRADKAPDISAFAGDSFQSCKRDMVIVSAAIPEPATGQWSSPDFDLLINDKDAPLTEVSGLKAGENRLIWSISSGICRNFDQDTVIINYLADPIANNLNVPIEAGDFTVIDPMLNDFFSSDVAFEILSSSPDIIDVTLIDGDLLEIRTSERLYGTAEIIYLICLLDCPEKCSQAKVTIVVGDVTDCEVPNIFTPNRDGINDSFIIPCLSGDRHPNNRLSVYDQWGSEVFTASPYKNDWEGMYNGRDLPEGTYFYVIEFGPGKSPVSGFVVIKR